MRQKIDPLEEKMSDWGILDGNDDGDDMGDVEYVGVVEDEAPRVQEPVARKRQAVRRVAPQVAQPFYPVAKDPRAHQNGVVGQANRDAEDLVSYIEMPYGKQLGLTAEAIERLHTAPVTNVNGQMAQRIEPGTYVMYGPSRADAMGMGSPSDWDPTGLPGYATADQASSAAYQQQTQSQNRDTSWIGGLIQGIASLGSGIATAVSQGRISQREAETERLRIRAEQAAAATASDIAFREAQLAHEERIEQIRAGTAELESLRAQMAEQTALRNQLQQAPAVTAPSGGSPLVWGMLALFGIGTVGGLVWYFGFHKKDKDKDKE